MNPWNFYHKNVCLGKHLTPENFDPRNIQAIATVQTIYVSEGVEGRIHEIWSRLCGEAGELITKAI